MSTNLTPATSTLPIVKRGPGRPKGSKNSTPVTATVPNTGVPSFPITMLPLTVAAVLVDGTKVKLGTLGLNDSAYVERFPFTMNGVQRRKGGSIVNGAISRSPVQSVGFIGAEVGKAPVIVGRAFTVEATYNRADGSQGSERRCETTFSVVLADGKPPVDIVVSFTFWGASYKMGSRMATPVAASASAATPTPSTPVTSDPVLDLL